MYLPLGFFFYNFWKSIFVPIIYKNVFPFSKFIKAIKGKILLPIVENILPPLLLLTKRAVSSQISPFSWGEMWGRKYLLLFSCNVLVHIILKISKFVYLFSCVSGLLVVPVYFIDPAIKLKREEKLFLPFHYKWTTYGILYILQCETHIPYSICANPKHNCSLQNRIVYC